MKYSNLFWGVIMILLGILFILKNLGIIFFDWRIFIDLWPLFLVLWGIALLPMKNVFKISLSFIVIAITIVIISVSPDKSNWHGWKFNDYNDDWGWEFRHEDDQEDIRDDTPENSMEGSRIQEFSEAYDENIEKAKITVEAAIGDFLLKEPTGELMEFTKNGNLGPYKIMSRTQNNTRFIDLDLEKKVFRGSGFKNKTELKLNKKPVWDIEIGAGAADIEMDLRAFKVNNFEIDGGASAVSIILGEAYPDIRLNVEAAASSIEIKIPEKSGCYIDVETFLSSKSFSGFEKTDDGNYQTKNYRTAANKIIINLNAAVADFTIKQY